MGPLEWIVALTAVVALVSLIQWVVRRLMAALRGRDRAIGPTA